MTNHRQDISAIPQIVLNWYDGNGRDLPWRLKPKQAGRQRFPPPYQVWLAEIMLQQTQVNTVIPYYENFLQRWPTVEKLAQSSLDDVLSAWAGLGYYRRARYLKQCAETVISNHAGQFPNSAAQLIKLPGIGAYTANAIGAISFGEAVVPIDGNLMRIACRLFGIHEPPMKATKAIAKAWQSTVSHQRPGDYAQALMDIGATICTPKTPDCFACPLSSVCFARKNDMAGALPARQAKIAKPCRKGATYIIQRFDGAIFFEKRPKESMLGSMLGLPTTGWSIKQDGKTGISQAPIAQAWQNLGTIKHSFTHFNLVLEVFACECDSFRPNAGKWIKPDEFDRHGIPVLFRKALKQIENV